MAEPGYKSLLSYKLAQTNPSLALVWATLGVKGGLGGKEGLEGVVNYLIDVLTRCGYLLDRQINAVELKHEREGGYREKLLKRRLAYLNRRD